jgi:hypothetical protein
MCSSQDDSASGMILGGGAPIPIGSRRLGTCRLSSVYDPRFRNHADFVLFVIYSFEVTRDVTT